MKVLDRGAAHGVTVSIEGIFPGVLRGEYEIQQVRCRVRVDATDIN